jgi:hypothetical protein
MVIHRNMVVDSMLSVGPKPKHDEPVKLFRSYLKMDLGMWGFRAPVENFK